MSGKSALQDQRDKRRILIVDDHPLVRHGLTALIDSEPDIIVCGAAATHEATVAAIACSRPDLVITDLLLADGDGWAMIEDIHSRYADLPILVLSMFDQPRYVERAFRAGASGYVTKQEMTETLLAAIRCVLGGEKFVSPNIQGGVEAP